MDEINCCKGPEAVKKLGVEGTEERPGLGHKDKGRTGQDEFGGPETGYISKALLPGLKGIDFILSRSYRPDLNRVET